MSSNSATTSLAVFLVVASLTQFPVAAAQGEQVWVPLSESSSTGSEKIIKLEATMYRPEGAGPFPIVIFSHGSTGMGAIPGRKTLRPDTLAKIFNGFGFAFIAP